MTYNVETGEVVPAQAEPRARNLIFASQECSEVFGALCDFQADCEPPKKTKTATVKGMTKAGREYEYKYQYAPLDEIHSVIRAPMAKAGLVQRQFLATMGEQWIMRTIVAHRSGQWIGCDYPIYIGEQRGQAQAFASGVTYARRYGLMLALGIVGEDDDDANVADAQPATITGQDRRDRPAPRTIPRFQEAAPAPSDAATEATKRWRELAAAIDSEENVEMLLRFTEWPAYKALDTIGAQAASSPDEHVEMMNLLATRARKAGERLGQMEKFNS